jgi:hypothetical protein
MKTGSLLFDVSRFTVAPQRGSERGELLDKFLERLNPSRIQAGYKPYNHARLSVMLQHLKTDELYPFYRQCEQAGIPFSAFFHWSLKPKTLEQSPANG